MRTSVYDFTNDLYDVIARNPFLSVSEFFDKYFAAENVEVDPTNGKITVGDIEIRITNP